MELPRCHLMGAVPLFVLRTASASIWRSSAFVFDAFRVMDACQLAKPDPHPYSPVASSPTSQRLCGIGYQHVFVEPYVIPVYKKGIHARSFVRSKRLRTDDLCHLTPRADLIPRLFSSIAIEASVSAPLARIAWITGRRPDANSSATSVNAALPMLPA
jgi:hypothetical protein